MSKGFALVQYDELDAGEDGAEKLREWFPLPGQRQASNVKLPGSYEVLRGPGYQLRPPPPAEVGEPGC